MAATADENAECVNIIFKGFDRPRSTPDAVDWCISGHIFLLHLAETDRLIAAALSETDMVQRPTAADQYHRIWRSLGAALFDYGLEVPDEEMFAIIAGQLPVAAQLANDLQRLNDKGYEPALLRQVGPRVPHRQRINPFRGTVNPVKGAIPQATRVYLFEQPRFSKKRAICVDNLERLRDKEMKQQKLREKRERENAQKQAEAQKSAEGAAHRVEQAEFMANKYSDDPKLMAEKAMRTELLRELERLETTYSNDERLLAKLKRENQPDSPRKVAPIQTSIAASHYALAASDKKGALAPVRLREPSAIPFSAGSPPQQAGNNTTSKGSKLPKTRK